MKKLDLISEIQNTIFVVLPVYLTGSSSYPLGAYFLGICYYQGIGTEIDLVQAEKWLTLAADDGETSIITFLAIHFWDNK